MDRARFRDRREAGRLLADKLEPYRDRSPVIVGLPRGGVVVADEVARALDAPLEVIVVRKVGAPAQPELGVGAVGPGGVRFVHPDIARRIGLSDADVDALAAREAREVERRMDAFGVAGARRSFEGQTVIVVDDGLATGGTAGAAVRVLREHAPARMVLAVPVCPPETADMLAKEVEDLVALAMPTPFFAVGEHYDDFEQVSDREVQNILSRAKRLPPTQKGVMGAVDADVDIAADGVTLPGHLEIPPDASGIVVFAHGSGSSRHSPRNVEVASTLRRGGFGTLLFDLLTDDEAADRANVFNVSLLGRRLVAATEFLDGHWETKDRSVGYFGASTGAAAALSAAAQMPERVSAVVSRGGRPDLAGRSLDSVTAATLLIVGELDREVLELNREALERLGGVKALEVVPGASHLFEEPGALEEVSRLAGGWFARHLG